MLGFCSSYSYHLIRISISHIILYLTLTFLPQSQSVNTMLFCGVNKAQSFCGYGEAMSHLGR